MARPIQRRLEYFPFDVSFFSDTKIRRLKTKYGNDGISVYIYLLCAIYGDHGYYTTLDEDLLLDVSDALDISDNLTRQIIDYLCSRSLLSEIHDSTLAAQVKVLTAKSIQRRYQEAKRGCKRTLFVNQAYWLLEPSETLSFVKVGNNEGFSANNEGFSANNEGFSEKNSQKQTETQTETQTQTEMKNKQNINRGNAALACHDEIEMIFLSVNGQMSTDEKAALTALSEEYGRRAVIECLSAMKRRIDAGQRISAPLSYLEAAVKSEAAKRAQTGYTDDQLAELEAMMDYDWNNE